MMWHLWQMVKWHELNGEEDKMVLLGEHNWEKSWTMKTNNEEIEKSIIIDKEDNWCYIKKIQKIVTWGSWIHAYFIISGQGIRGRGKGQIMKVFSLYCCGIIFLYILKVCHLSWFHKMRIGQ